MGAGCFPCDTPQEKKTLAGCRQAQHPSLHPPGSVLRPTLHPLPGPSRPPLPARGFPFTQHFSRVLQHLQGSEGGISAWIGSRVCPN